MNPERAHEAEYNLAVLHRAQAFQDLLEQPGWRWLLQQRVAALERLRAELRRMPITNQEAAVMKLLEWQLAENAFEAEAEYINRTLAEADEIRGAVTIDDALRMENYREQSQSTQSNANDRTGA